MIIKINRRGGYMRTLNVVLIPTLLALIPAQGFGLPQTKAASDDQVSGLYQGVAKMPAGSKDLNFVVEIKSEALERAASLRSNEACHEVAVVGARCRVYFLFRPMPQRRIMPGR